MVDTRQVRFLLWRGVDEWLAEAASVDLAGDGLRAAGVQFGAEPVPYRLDYRLDASTGFVTRELEISAVGEGWRRRLMLRHDGSGGWRSEVDSKGEPPGERRDDEPPDLVRARDIDVGFSPLTNSMPILRHGLHRSGSHDFVIAFVSVPDLRVIAASQRYEHVGVGGEGAIVRFLDGESDFSAELELDGDGLLRFYPQLARRVLAQEMAADAD